MKYIKRFENLDNDFVSLCRDNKFLILSPKKDNIKYLVEYIELKDDYIVTKKLYTLKNNLITKNKHQYYIVKIDKLKDECIYYSDNLKDVRDVLNTIVLSKKYNL